MSNTVVPGRLPDEDLAENFAERLARLTDGQAHVEASRCLFCFDAPCMVACPTSIDIPSFIKRIEQDDTLGAANKILDANVLGASCARVCATEELCEEACVLEAHERPIQIGRLQRYATDTLIDAGLPLPYEVGADTGKSVAVVGGGPAGLATAARLRQHGHDVTIFERHEHLGGLATYGIIPLREPTEIALWEAEQVIALGVEARTNTEVGVDIAAQELLDNYDAIFVSNGSGRFVLDIGLDGSSATGVDDALEFIEAIRVKDPGTIPVGNSVTVIGAGNTAMDACTIAIRLGAPEVTCIYRRTAAEMTGYPNEYEHCKSEGVQFRWLTQPLQVLTDDSGAVNALECAVMELSAPGADGRPAPVDSGRRITIPTDHVLLATGQQREPAVYTQLGVTANLDGRPAMRTDFHTTADGIFAGGDSVLSGKELSVVDAVAQGRDAANEIDSYLREN